MARPSWIDEYWDRGFVRVLPAVAVIWQEQLVAATENGIRLLPAGRVVHVALVLTATAVLMNVERTFRTSVGMMRWQMKFIVIGVAVLMLTRVYTSTQALLFSAAALPLDRLNAAAIGICSVLGLISIKRAHGFMLDLYPASAVPFRSFTLMVVGGYRIFGLAAGEYYISASPRSIGSTDIKQMTTAEIQSVMQTMQHPRARHETGARCSNASRTPRRRRRAWRLM